MRFLNRAIQAECILLLVLGAQCPLQDHWHDYYSIREPLVNPFIENSVFRVLIRLRYNTARCCVRHCRGARGTESAAPGATRRTPRCFLMQNKRVPPINPKPTDKNARNGKEPSVDPEVELVERAKSNADAFSELYERYVDRIYAYIYYRTGDARDAEDLTARVFHRALGHLGDYRQTGAPFVAWLYRIAHNVVANWHRDKTRHPELPLELWAHAPVLEAAPHAQAERAEAERALLDAIRSLPAERQQLLLLKFVDGMSNVEIGKTLGRSEGAIKSLYHRTLLSLREELVKRGIRDST